MNHQLISQTIVRRSAEVRERFNQLWNIHVFGENGPYRHFVKEDLRPEPDRISKLTAGSHHQIWASAYTGLPHFSESGSRLQGPKANRSRTASRSTSDTLLRSKFKALRAAVFALLRTDTVAVELFAR
jgi:hypothetical protein